MTDNDRHEELRKQRKERLRNQARVREVEAQTMGNFRVPDYLGVRRYVLKELDDCTAGDLHYIVKQRRRRHHDADVPFSQWCLGQIMTFEMFIRALNAQGVATVGELDKNMTMAEAMTGRQK